MTLYFWFISYCFFPHTIYVIISNDQLSLKVNLLSINGSIKYEIYSYDHCTFIILSSLN